MVLGLCLGALALSVFYLVFAPVRVHLTLQARGEDSGAWVLGGGAQVGPVAMSSLAARNVRATVQLHVFRWQPWSREIHELWAGKAGAKAKEPRRSPRDSYRRLERWFDPERVATFLLGTHRRVRVERLEVDLEYSFRDVALTGKLLGALYALSGVMPSRVAIRQRAGWEAKDAGALALTGTIKVWPGRLAMDAAWFAAQNLKLRASRRDSARKPTGAIEPT